MLPLSLPAVFSPNPNNKNNLSIFFGSAVQTANPIPQFTITGVPETSSKRALENLKTKKLIAAEKQRISDENRRKSAMTIPKLQRLVQEQRESERWENIKLSLKASQETLQNLALELDARFTSLLSPLPGAAAQTMDQTCPVNAEITKCLEKSLGPVGGYNLKKFFTILKEHFYVRHHGKLCDFDELEKRKDLKNTLWIVGDYHYKDPFDLLLKHLFLSGMSSLDKLGLEHLNDELLEFDFDESVTYGVNPKKLFVIDNHSDKKNLETLILELNDKKIECLKLMKPLTKKEKKLLSSILDPFELNDRLTKMLVARQNENKNKKVNERWSNEKKLEINKLIKEAHILTVRLQETFSKDKVLVSNKNREAVMWENIKKASRPQIAEFILVGAYHAYQWDFIEQITFENRDIFFVYSNEKYLADDVQKKVLTNLNDQKFFEKLKQ